MAISIRHNGVEHNIPMGLSGDELKRRIESIYGVSKETPTKKSKSVAKGRSESIGSSPMSDYREYKIGDQVFSFPVSMSPDEVQNILLQQGIIEAEQPAATSQMTGGIDPGGIMVPEEVGQGSLPDAADALKAGAIGAIQGLSGQAADELTGYAGRAGTPLAGGFQGPIPPEAFKEVRDEFRRQEDIAAAENPAAYYGGQIGGTLAGGGKIASAVGAGRSLPAAVPRIAAAEGAYAASASGFGQPGEGMDTEQMARTGLTAAVLSPAIPILGHGIGSAWRRLTDPDARAVRKIMSDIATKGKTPEEYVAPLAKDPENLLLADVGSGPREMMAKAAHTDFGIAERVKNLTSERLSKQADRLEKNMQRVFGKKTSIETLEKQWNKVKKQVKPVYDRINETVVNPSQPMRKILQTKTGKQALDRAKILAENEDRAIKTFVDEATGEEIIESLSGRDLDFIQRAFRQLATEADAAAQTGRSATGTLGHSYRGLRDRFLKSADRVLPGFKKTRRLWASQAELEEAETLGRTFFTLKSSKAKPLIKDLSPREKEMAAYGFFQEIIDRTGGVGDATSLVNQFGKKNIRETMKLLFSKEATRNYLNRLEVEGMMDEFRKTVGRPATSPDAIKEEFSPIATGFFGNAMWRLKVAMFRKMFANPRQAKTARALEDYLMTNDPKPLLRDIEKAGMPRMVEPASARTAAVAPLVTGAGNAIFGGQ